MTLTEPQRRESGDRPVWRALSDPSFLSITDAGLRDLLVVTGSLTRRLRQLCGDAFRLRVLGERDNLDTPGLTREVLLLCGELPWVFAQTVVPPTTLADNPWLRELGDRPLGDTLFDRPHVIRKGLFFARLSSGHALYDRAVRDAGLNGSPALWARRSVISILDADLTINEVFLPRAGHCAKA